MGIRNKGEVHNIEAMIVDGNKHIFVAHRWAIGVMFRPLSSVPSCISKTVRSKFLLFSRKDSEVNTLEHNIHFFDLVIFGDFVYVFFRVLTIGSF